MNIKNTKLQKALATCLWKFLAAHETKYAWCLHHGMHYDLLDAPITERLRHFFHEKPPSEWIVRLNNFRPVLDTQRLELTYEELVGRTYLINKRVYRKSQHLTGDALNKVVNQMSIDNRPHNKWFERQLMKQHREEWPTTTWDGKDIF